MTAYRYERPDGASDVVGSEIHYGDTALVILSRDGSFVEILSANTPASLLQLQDNEIIVPAKRFRDEHIRLQVTLTVDIPTVTDRTIEERISAWRQRLQDSDDARAVLNRAAESYGTVVRSKADAMLAGRSR